MTKKDVNVRAHTHPQWKVQQHYCSPCQVASGELWPHSCPLGSVLTSILNDLSTHHSSESKGFLPFTSDPCLTPSPNPVLSTTLSESLCPHTSQGLSNLKFLHLELPSPALPEETDTVSPFRTKMCILRGLPEDSPQDMAAFPPSSLSPSAPQQSETTCTVQLPPLECKSVLKGRPSSVV